MKVGYVESDITRLWSRKIKLQRWRQNMEKAYKLSFETEYNEGLVVTNCGFSKTEPLHSFGPALKPNYVIHFVLDGKGVFSIGGKNYTLEPGSGFLIPPGELAFYQADEKEPWTYVWVGFSGNKAQNYISDIGLSSHTPIFSSTEHEGLSACIKDMIEHNTYGVANELRRVGQLYVFLSMITKENTVEKHVEKDNQYVKRAIEFIQSNYHIPIKVTDIAEYVCINRSYLYSLFQESTKMSPHQFLSRYRIAKAAELLLTSSLSIESICYSVGYKDPFVFTKAFKQTMKMSPTMYRKEKKEAESKMDKDFLNQIEVFLNKD